MFSQNLGWERPTREEHARSLLPHFKLFSELVLRFSSRVLAGVLPPAGQIFEKWRPLENVERFSELFLQFSSRVLAGVLPPAGQFFEKWHLLKIFDTFLYFFATFKQGASSSAASGGSDFWKMAPALELWQLPILFLWLCSRGLAGVLPPAGQIFEKLHLPNIFDIPVLFCNFKVGG